MKIKTKLLLTNIAILAVMVLLAFGYNMFTNALSDKFSLVTTDATAISAACDILTDSGLERKEKSDALSQLGYAFSVYRDDPSNNGKVMLEYSNGYKLKGYTFTNLNITPKIVMFSDKIVLESKVGNEHLVAVKTSNREKEFDRYNSIAIAVMIFVCGVAVCIACSYQFYTLFPPLKVLSGALKQITAGNYSYQLKQSSHDEIGSVIGEFEMMRRKLVELNEQKSEFDRQRGEIIAGISHDLKTPLTTIRGYTKGLIDGVANTPEKEQRYLKTIYDTSDTMNSLINQLNDFAKMDIDKIEYTFMERDMVKLLSDFAAINVPIYASRGLVVTTDFPQEEINADVDKQQFLRVVQNVLDNSVKYKCKAEGHAHIKVSAENGFVNIELSDDGPGVSPHELNYIFESYYRGDPSRTNPTTGSGLGLSIVKTIITAHGGTVHAVSEDGLKIIIKIPQRRKRV